MKVGNIEIANDKPLAFIGGPCQIESYEHAERHALALSDICQRWQVPFIFKSSFDKANRTKHDTPRGVGASEGLAILKALREKYKIATTTDVHTPEQAHAAATHVDLLQIPAFLCRQTDLLIAAAQTGKPVNVKKGQFMAPADMAHVIKKIESTGNRNILITERGTCFGYNDLVVDMRGLLTLREFGYPVIFDCTHSTPNNRRFATHLAKAATAIGVAAIFAEVHADPDRAPSDGPSMLKLEQFDSFLHQIKMFDFND